MMRLLCITVMTTLLASCQTVEPGPDSQDELTHILEFSQTLDQRDGSALATETDQIRELLQQSDDASTAMRLRLILLESQIQLRELRQIHEAQEQQIQALNTQIEALTAIEQQINRRGQQQESNDE